MNPTMTKPMKMSRQERLARLKAANDRVELTAQQSADHISKIAGDARGVATVLSAFLGTYHVGDHVSVSCCRRAQQLLKEAVDFLDTAADRLEVER